MNRTSEHTDLTIPNGWYAVAFSRDLIEGDVKPVHYFAQDLVVFRTRDGEARVLDAYCPHLGAHLGEGGRVMGDSIRCPFHGWQYDGTSGQCVKIPYCERIPPKARVKAWEVCERNGFIFVWHHTEDKPPQWDFALMPEIGHDDWTEPRPFMIDVPVHVQDMHENNNDPVHFEYVHGMTDAPPSSIEYGEDGRYVRIQHTAEHDTPMGTFEMTLLRESWNIGLSSVRSIGIPGAGLLLYSSTSPVDANRTHSRWLLTVTRNLADVAGEEFMENITKGVLDDMPIWENKVHRADPVLCEADKELVEYRKWVKQFYTNPV
jgi:phenylpropionate dioxygenase-like ring-hydroxylating dioxygenase large terminal subunit